MYQRVITAYNEPDHRRGKMLIQEFIKTIIAPDLPIEIIEVKRLGMTLKKIRS